jgi:hypothetical protein
VAVLPDTAARGWERITGRALKKGVAYIVRGEGASSLVPFEFDGVGCLVPASELRHLHRHCAVTSIALETPGTWVERVQNNAELRVRTSRCSGGCWEAFERAEQRAIARGDEVRRIDWEEDGVRGRRRLLELVRSGSLPSAQVLEDATR